LKLSKAPNMRTVIIAVLAFILIGTAVDALAKELRVTTAQDLVNCVTGAALASGPDAGKVAAAGDTCVVFPGTYDLAPPVGTPADIVIENLTLRSTNGATATIITFTGGYPGGLVNIVNRGVTVGGPAPDQGFTITNPAPNGGVGICVTDPIDPINLCGVVAAGGQAANENITIQNNTIRQNANEGILFHYDTAVTAIDTIRILKNEIRNNGGDGLAFDNTVGAIGRRGVDRNVVIDGNKFDDNGNGANFAAGSTFANIHFYNNTSIEQLAILNNEITRAGATTPPADGILFNNDLAGNVLTEIRDALIDRNLIQFNTQNGIKFDYAGRLGENVTISNNRGVTPDQGITHNGPAVVAGGAEGNGIYITGRVNDVRELKIVNNAINSNRGWDGLFPGDGNPAADLDGNGAPDTCRHGNGLSIEAGGRVENLTLDGNDFRQNFNNGVCIANNGDFSRSTVTNNKFHNNGVGDYINSVAEAPYGDGFGVYHDTTINGGAAPRWSEGFRIESITFSGNDYRQNGGNNAGAAGTESLVGTSGLGFGVFLRVERGEISRITFENENATRNFLGGFRLETDTDLATNRSGDIREITWKNVTSVESQGAPGIGFALANDYDVGDNGDGIGHITDNGDISMITVTNVVASGNGTFGLRLESDASAGAKPEAVAVPAGDIDNAKITDSTFNFNGTRGAVGRGSGILIAGDSVRTVTIDPTEASTNNDHGVQVTGNRNVSSVTVKNSTFNNNDRNRDTVGDGVQVNANEDLSNVVVQGVTANSNYAGIRVGAAGRQIAQNVLVENSTANNNTKEGIAFFAGRDLITAKALKNQLSGNGIGIYVEAVQRGNDISLSENKIVGANGQGVGIQLKSSNVSIDKNDIRNNETGILVHKASGSKANNNNIARNEKFGVDASALAPGEEFDATNNWWGEPSGPKAADNPGGIGDRVSQKVKYRPFLGEPAVPTETDFVVESLTASKTDVTVGESVTFNYTIKNNGTEEGTQEVTVVIKDGLGNVVNQSSRQITVNPAGSRQENFSFIFQTPGTYTVTVTAQPSGSTKSVTVSVAGTAACLPFALDNNPKNQKIDDAEIITAIDLWVRGGAVPGCSPPVTISDTQIIQLIDLWVKQSQLTVPLGGKMTSQSATLSVASTFATLGASVRAVRPGESFTVTVSVDAKDGISGLLLSQALPAGWSAKPIQLSGAYYKASENKWLWLNAKGTVSVSYEVTVPATAQPGLYTIAGRVKAAVPGIESELQPLTIEVLGAPVALAVKAITLSQQPVRSSGAYFIVEGVGIAQTTVRVFSMTGKLVFSQTAQGNVVPFSAAAELANGVYLYVVTVQGADGQTLTSKLAKLVVLR
jgi:parallel beta-helix repeat protein